MRWVIKFPSSPMIAIKKCILQLIHEAWSSMGNQPGPEQAPQQADANTKSVPAFCDNLQMVPTTFLNKDAFNLSKKKLGSIVLRFKGLIISIVKKNTGPFIHDMPNMGSLTLHKELWAETRVNLQVPHQA